MREPGDLLQSVAVDGRPGAPPTPRSSSRARLGHLAPAVPAARNGNGAGEVGAGAHPPGTGRGAAAPLDGQLTALLRDVVQLAAREGGPEGLVVDTVVDGRRCVLACAPATPSESRLSPREREIARMVAAGCPNKTIAAALEISTWTVGSHLRRIFAKLDVTTRAAMTARLAGAEALERLLGEGPEI